MVFTQSQLTRCHLQLILCFPFSFLTLLHLKNVNIVFIFHASMCTCSLKSELYSYHYKNSSLMHSNVLFFFLFCSRSLIQMSFKRQSYFIISVMLANVNPCYQFKCHYSLQPQSLDTYNQHVLLSLFNFLITFPPGDDPLRDKDISFRINRYRRFSDFFDEGDGDWLWLDINIGEHVFLIISWQWRCQLVLIVFIWEYNIFLVLIYLDELAVYLSERRLPHISVSLMSLNKLY